jgi:putative acetyltransferase
MKIRPAEPAEHGVLLDIWLRSVRATHGFLSEAQIQALLPLVRDHALPALDLWLACSDDGRILGFMGLDGPCIEALFLAPESMRQGVGSRLVAHAQSLAGGPLRVDVNEENPAALAFYVAQGFRVTGRSPVDGGGRPHPLLHLSR